MVTKTQGLLIALMLLIWGSYSTTSRIIMNSLDSFQTLFFMMLGATLCSGVILAIKRKTVVFVKSDIGLLTLQSTMYFGYYIFFDIALMIAPTLEVSMIDYLYPIFVVLFSALIMRQRVKLGVVISLLIGFFGVYVIMTNGNLLNFTLTNPVGDMLAVLSAISWGLYSGIGNKIKSDMNITVALNNGISLILALVCLLLFSNFNNLDIKSVLLALFLGCTNLTLAVTIWVFLMKSVPVGFLANCSFITLFISITMISIFIGDRLGPAQIVGALIIVVAMIISNRVQRKTA